jgi:putative DNA primase/helicase
MPQDDGTPGAATPGAPVEQEQIASTSDITAASGTQQADVIDLATRQSVPAIRNVPYGELSPEKELGCLELHAAALKYQNLGFRVIPVNWIEDDGTCHCGRRAECPSPGKHPVDNGWQKAGGSDSGADARWWRTLEPEEMLPGDWRPEANIGILTGEVSGIFVLDVDPDNGGEETLAQLEKEHGELPLTRIHATGSGGVHYLYRHPGFRIGNSASKVVGKGLDIRGDGGQVVAPPSISLKGSYECSNPAHDIEPADAPQWLLDRLREQYDRDHGRVVGNPDAVPTGLLSKYVQAALKGEAETLRNAPYGGRNNMLNQCAFSLGTLGAHGLLDEGSAWAALHDAALACGLGEGETRATFRSGWNKGLEKPRDLSGIALLAGQEWPRLPWNEAALGDRLVIYRGDVIRWVDAWQSWMHYVNGAWRRCHESTVERLAQDVIRLLPMTELPQYPDEAEGEEENSPREHFRQWHEKQLTRGKFAAAAKIARDRPKVQATPDQFDAAPGLFNTANCVIDLATGERMDHDPDLMLTLQSPFTYDPDAKCPRWERFISEVLPDPETAHYLRKALYYSLTGRNDRKIIFFLLGHHDTGKSVLVETMLELAGAYGWMAATGLLRKNNSGSGPTNDVNDLKARRFVASVETNEGQVVDEALLKSISGGDRQTNRGLYQGNETWQPQCTLWVASNHELTITSNNASVYSRLQVIPFNVQFSPDSEEHPLDPNLKEDLRMDLPGILNWILGAREAFQAEGLKQPQEVRAASEKYRLDQDHVAQFIHFAIEAGVLMDVGHHASPKSSCIPRSALHDLFVCYCQRIGLSCQHTKKVKGFSLRLASLGFPIEKSQGIYRSIGLRQGTGSIEDLFELI